MILERANWCLGYSQILTDCRKDEDGEASALVLCHPDVDAMATGRILSYMLRNDGISHQLLPCMSFSQMSTTLQQQQQNQQDTAVRAVVLINLGATRNLTHLFQFLDPEATKLYILDCRRPVHLANIHAETNVVVFWDGIQDSNDLPSDGDNLSGDESSTDSSEGDDDDEDDDESLDEGEHEFQMEDDDEGEAQFGEEEATVDSPPKANPEAEDVGQNQDTDYDGEDEMDDGPRKRRKEIDPAAMDSDDMSLTAEETQPTQASTQDDSASNKPPLMTPRELHEDRRNRLREYYSAGSYYGMPAAFTAYTIAEQLRFKDVGDLLWLACVGVTDAYVHARLDLSGYVAIATELKHSVHRLFPNDEFTRATNTIYSEELMGNTTSQQKTRIGFSGNGQILTETDFRFFLLRHTSLYDAMVYSDYISTRFQLLTVKGKHKLQEMLAKMGFPLDQCHQPFAFMKPALRRQLPHKLKEYSEEYGLTNFEFTSFFRITGYQSLLSACDTSYAVTALLECDVAPKDADEEERLLQSFNTAFDALNSNQTPTVSLNGLSGEGSNLSNLVNGGKLTGNSGLGAGIRLAMSLQKNIMATATSLIDRNALTRLNHFRYAYITCTSQHESGVGGEDENSNNAPLSSNDDDSSANHVFSKPLALSRLAHYLMDLHRENGKWAGTKARPLILVSEKPQTKTFLIVGYEYPESAGDLVKNRFGRSFELTAQSMKGNFVFDSFDSNVVEVARSEAQRFIEQLHYMMDNL